MAYLIGNNAVGWSQFQLNGGWKNTLGVLAAYGVIVGGLIVISASLDPRQASTILSGWTKGLLGLQLAILVIYGSNRIIGGIRRDVTGSMIESHRLMPIPPLHAVLGYIFGAASQAMALAGVNVVLGAATSRAAGLPVDYWFKANGVVFSFSVFLWTVVAVAALSTRGALFWVVGPIVGFWLSGGALSLLVPAVAVLATPTQGVSVFDARLGSRLAEMYAVPLMCQGLLAVICLAAAVRKYRRPDDAALSPPLALGLLAAVTLACTMGIRLFEEVGPVYLREEGDLDVQMVSSTLLLMCVITAVMCAVAWAEALARRNAVRIVAPRPRRVLPPVAGAILAAAIGAGINAADPPRDWGEGTFLRYSVGMLLVQALAVSYLARWVYARVDRAGVIVAIWLALTWIAPLIIDLMLRTLSESESNLGTPAAWSPIGCLVALVVPEEVDADPRVGLLGQAALAVIPMLLYHLDQLRTKRPAAAPITIESVGAA